MEVPDLYAVPGTEPSATVGVIVSAYRREVRELRPDTRVGAVTAERTVQLRSADETLRDPARRGPRPDGVRAEAPQPGRVSPGSGTSVGSGTSAAAPQVRRRARHHGPRTAIARGPVRGDPRR